MKRYIYYIGCFVAAAGMMSLASCTDFADYNDTPADANAQGNQTLWQNICANPDLSNFKALVEKAGFAESLNGSQYYTVWAPTNAYLNTAAYDTLSQADLLDELVKNHVTDYNYTMTGDMNERVRTLNKKSYVLLNGATSSFDGISVVEKNIGSSNGVLHTLGGVAPYYPNAYTYLLTKSAGVDSLKAYFQKYEISYLDKENSVVGPIVDGKQTYVDSVTVTQNVVSSNLRASLDNEDSTYTFILPTDKSWKEEYAKVKKYYNIIQKTPIKTYNSTTGVASTTTVNNTNNAFLIDSLVKKNIVANLVYSNNDYYNKWLLTSAADKAVDTLRTPRYKKLGNPETLLSHEIARVPLSNGQAIIVDTIDAHSWDTYSDEMIFDARSNYANVTSGSATNRDLTIGENGVTYQYQFLYIEPGSNVLPDIKIALPQVKSDAYQVYVAFGPGYNVVKLEEDTLVNQFHAGIEYSNASGALTTQWFGDKFEANQSKEANGHVYQTKAGILHDSITGRIVTDTVYIGKVTFPVSYSGIGETKGGPLLSIKAYVKSLFNKNEMAKYSRIYRIMSVILKPVDLDTYEKSLSNTQE